MSWLLLFNFILFTNWTELHRNIGGSYSYFSVKSPCFVDSLSSLNKSMYSCLVKTAFPVQPPAHGMQLPSLA